RLPPGPDPGPIEAGVRELRQRLLTEAKNEKTDVSLEIEGVTADRQPNVFWEVYVGLPKGAAASSESPHYVGNIALFGHGVRDQHQHGGSEPAAFSFKINRAVQAALERDATGKLDLAFVARGAVTKEPRAGATRNAVNLTIGKARLALRRLKQT
ncbi:MAG TPA: hypothetical protein VGE98_08115, partial [Thermoanaerobaculia bacterium]